MKNALLLGSYGQSNLGDELMLSIFINFLKSRKYNVYVNSSNAKKTACRVRNAHKAPTAASKKCGNPN